MTVTALGEMTVGAAMPGAQAAAAAGVEGIGAVAPDLDVQVSALAGFVPQPISLSAQLSIAQQTLASVQAAITASLPIPDLAAQAAATAAITASLQVRLTLAQVQLAYCVELQATLDSGSVAAFAYSGARGSIGAELGAAVAVPGQSAQHVNAVLLVTKDPATWSALSAVLKVT